jgi:hypothetical protein
MFSRPGWLWELDQKCFHVALQGCGEVRAKVGNRLEHFSRGHISIKLEEVWFMLYLRPEEASYDRECSDRGRLYSDRPRVT